MACTLNRATSHREHPRISRTLPRLTTYDAVAPHLFAACLVVARILQRRVRDIATLHAPFALRYATTTSGRRHIVGDNGHRGVRAATSLCSAYLLLRHKRVCRRRISVVRRRRANARRRARQRVASNNIVRICFAIFQQTSRRDSGIIASTDHLRRCGRDGERAGCDRGASSRATWTYVFDLTMLFVYAGSGENNVLDDVPPRSHRYAAGDRWARGASEWRRVVIAASWRVRCNV